MNALTPDQVYRQWSELFTAAHTTEASAPPLVFRVADQRIEARCTSRVLRERLRRPLRHLETPSTGQAPDLRLDWVDCTASGVPMPVLPWPPQHASLDQDTREVRQKPFIFTAHGDHVLTALDGKTQRMIGFVRDAADWPLDHYKQALFISLYQHLRYRGLHLIHASAISRHGQAILIAGSSGAGKTTAMLRCVQAGFQYLSDDSTLVTRGAAGSGAARAVTLLSALHVTDQTLAWFPELAPHVSPAASARGKRLVMIDAVYPGCVTLESQVSLILVPQITGEARSSVAHVSKAKLLSDMLPYSLDLADGATAGQQLAFLAELLETTPTFRLNLGRDWQQLPALLGDLLDS
jgi:hypothetical protein